MSAIPNFFKKHSDKFLLMGIFLFAHITFLFILIHIVILILHKPKKTGKLNKKYTETIRKITNNPNIEIREINNKTPSSFYYKGDIIYYTTGIKKLLTKDRQIISVLLHEYHHYEKNDKYKNTVCVTMMYVILYTLVNLKLKNPFRIDTYFFNNHFFAFFAFFIVQKLYLITFGKKIEYAADENTIKYGYKKEFIESLKILENYVQNKLKKELCSKQDSNEQCDKKIEKYMNIDAFFSEHPTFKKRVENIRKKYIKLSLYLISKQNINKDGILHTLDKHKSKIKEKLENLEEN